MLFFFCMFGAFQISKDFQMMKSRTPVRQVGNPPGPSPVDSLATGFDLEAYRRRRRRRIAAVPGTRAWSVSESGNIPVHVSACLRVCLSGCGGFCRRSNATQMGMLCELCNVASTATGCRGTVQFSDLSSTAHLIPLKINPLLT